MESNGSSEFLNSELEAQKIRSLKLKEECKRKIAELEASKKKSIDLKHWLNTLLTSNESKLDIIPQVRIGLGEIELLRNECYEFRRQLLFEKRRTEILKQEFFRVKKIAKEQQIDLNNIEKGVMILEKEALEKKINQLSAELDQLSGRNTLYMKMGKEDEWEFLKRYQESIKQLMKLKGAYMKLLNSLECTSGPILKGSHKSK